MRYIQMAFLAGLIISCAVNRPTGKTEAEVLYKESLRLMKDNRYLLATEKLNILRSQYPYSYYATVAELTLADILFLQENFEESAAAYLLFRDFHPKHKQIDYVVFRIAESYYNQRPPTYDRDLAPAIKAIKYYNELKSLYPNSKYLKDADKKIKISQEMIINKEKYIADFYYRTEDYESAKFRYENIANTINVKDVKSLAVVRLLDIGDKTSNVDLCKSIFLKHRGYFQKKELENIEKRYLNCIKN